MVVGMVVASKLLRPVIHETAAEARSATDRLVQAHRDGYQIPHRDEPAVSHTVEPLWPSVQAFCDDFDDQGRALYESKARSLRESGGDEYYVLAQLRLMQARSNDFDRIAS